MTSLIIFSVVISMLYFINTLYFVLSLLLVILITSVYSIYLGCFSALFSIMLVIIYVGAMIIFIGYICAISPNILFLYSSPSLLGIFALLVSLLSLSIPHSSLSNLSPLTDFLYSSSGLFLFFIVALVLFLVLMVVSSQFFSPQGPFRSVS